MTALEAAQALVEALDLRFGEVTVQVTDGSITLVRHGTVLKPADLERLPVPAHGNRSEQLHN